MGAVYDAIHAKTGRRVALKLIHERTITSGGPAARRRFEREARAAAAVDSLHVVQILDSGDDERSGMPFIVMEYLQGVDLRAVLSRGPLPERLAIAVATQISMALHKAHEGEVIHRDLKPANVFISKADGGRRIVKLLDFGIAKIASEGSETVDLTSTGDLVGSPPYMSPEQLCSPRDVDPRTDVWSLGVVLYEMLCGETPTHGINPIGRRVYAICHTPAARIESRVLEVSPQLAAIVHRALAIDPKQRFASMLEMHRELRSLLRGSSMEIRDTDLAAHVPDWIDTSASTVTTRVPSSGASRLSSTDAFVVETVRTPSPMAAVSGGATRHGWKERSARGGWILAGVAALGVTAAFGVASILSSSPTPAHHAAAAKPPPAVEPTPAPRSSASLASSTTIELPVSPAATSQRPTIGPLKKTLPAVAKRATPTPTPDSREKL